MCSRIAICAIRAAVGSALSCCFALALVGCPEPDPIDDDDIEDEPVDVQALLWCVLSEGSGETAEGEEVRVRTTDKNRGACLCLPVGTQPTTGSELDQILHQMAIDKCIEDLEALGAVTTNCEESVPGRSIDYERWCEPDQWPPPPE